MLLEFFPKQLAARRLAELPTSAVSDPDGTQIVPTTFELSVLPDYLPHTLSDSDCPVNPAIDVHNDLPFEQTEARKRITKFMLFNRGSQEANPGTNPGGKLLSQFKMPAIFLEQQILTSGRLVQRLVDGGSTTSRASDGAPCVLVEVDGISTKLSMKKSPSSISLVKDFGAGDFRTSASQVPNSKLGWAVGYTMAADSEPDGVTDSMEHYSNWSGTKAPIMRVHLANKANPIYHMTFPKTKEDRAVGRDFQQGICDATSNDVYHVLHDIMQEEPPVRGSVCGVMFPGSNSGATYGGDYPSRQYAQAAALATSEILLQSIRIAWRTQLLTLSLYTLHRSVIESDPEVKLAGSWHTSPATLQERSDLAQYIRALLYVGGWAEVGGSRNYTQLEVTLAQGVVQNGYASSGAPELSAPDGFYCYTEANESFAPSAVTSQGPVEGFDHDVGSFGRCMLAASGAGGSWSTVANAYTGLCSDATASTLGKDTHLCYFASSITAAFASSGATVDVDAANIPEAAYFACGQLCGVASNPITALFEDDIENDVSGWDGGGSFFNWFFTNQGDL